MTSNPSTVYLVTGSNRGIGLGLVTVIASTHPDAFIYAGVRDTSARTEALQELSEKHPGRIAIVKCVSGDAAGNAALAEDIKARHGRVDTVIANAGISNSNKNMLTETAPEFEEHFRVNVLGPVILFQAFHGLLKESASPRFVPISSAAASISGFLIELDIVFAAYGISKSALNYATRKIHFENKWLTTFPLSPGGVDTDMLRNAVERDVTGSFKEIAKNLSFTPLTIYESATKCLKVIDNSTREETGGLFFSEEGTALPW